MQELIKKLNRRYTMSMFVTNAMMYDTMNDERKEAADLIESQAAEIENLQSLWTIAHNERSEAMLELAKERSVCDQLGKALEEVTALALCGKKDQLPGRCDQITKIAYKTLKAWRKTK